MRLLLDTNIYTALLKDAGAKQLLLNATSAANVTSKNLNEELKAHLRDSSLSSASNSSRYSALLLCLSTALNTASSLLTNRPFPIDTAFIRQRHNLHTFKPFHQGGILVIAILALLPAATSADPGRPWEVRLH